MYSKCKQPVNRFYFINNTDRQTLAYYIDFSNEQEYGYNDYMLIKAK